MSFYKNTFVALTFGLALSAFAQDKTLKQAFDNIDGYRGPFGKNIIQGEGGRLITPSFPPKRLFQGAFRSNGHGRAIARNYDFYIGNLFPSNYYELMEEYVFRDKYGLEAAANDNQPDTASYKPYRPLDNEALVANGAKAMPRAVSMARHWVLEKYYTRTFPQAVLSRSFLRWGSGDSADEEIYARLFLNFYLSSMTSDLQYLPAFTLLKLSTVGGDEGASSLQTARNLVANIPNDPSSELSRIRNAIHNQLSPAVIPMIDSYVARNGRDSRLAKVRAILVEFYSFNPDKIAKLATKLGQTEIADLAKILSADLAKKRVSSLDSLYVLSARVASLKNNIGNVEMVPTAKKTDVLVLISYATQLLNSKLTDDKSYSVADVASNQGMQIMLNTFYMEGLFIAKNWLYFVDKVKNAKSDAERAGYLAQATKIGTDTIVKAVQPSLDQWKTVEPKMEKFIDDAAKSSALNTASVALLRIANKDK